MVFTRCGVCDPPYEVYVGELSGGRFVVAFLNRTPLPREVPNTTSRDI
jgi:hypothetical protein